MSKKAPSLKTIDMITLRRKTCDYCHTPKTTCIVIILKDEGWVQNSYICLTCIKNADLKPLPPKVDKS